MLRCSEGRVPIVLPGLFYISGKNPIYPHPPHQVRRHVSRRWLRNGSINQWVKGSVYSTPPVGFASVQPLGLFPVTRARPNADNETTVWDCVTRRRDPRLAVNSGQARLSPLGFPARL